MSGSKSALEDATIENEIQKAIQKIYESKKLENLTVRRVRAAVEQSLGLEDGYLRKEEWKDRSKAYIERTVAEHDEMNASPKKPHPATSGVAQDLRANSKKPKRNSKTTKRHSSSEERDADIDLSMDETVSALNEKSKGIAPVRKADPKDISGSDESELSSVIDEMPKPKRKRKADNEDSSKARKKPNRSKKDQATDQDPQDEEIKRLKGWLAKCGIRKMWFRELQNYNTPQAKIKHLKQMLSDAGMTGRYSIEKATQIRESRELQEDLEAVQQGARQWGKFDGDDDNDNNTKRGAGDDKEVQPRRRIARGLEGLDFLDDDDGEESD